MANFRTPSLEYYMTVFELETCYKSTKVGKWAVKSIRPITV
jgi:hypothetical protein